ncbi:hypothetical protein E2562_038782 [Oryza meyeriana var. granulata]|uniref:Uncharacterized protein n=1 Tax=Oryza meyeriana var. granulata TaxID=110450 RepID=A0A6G1FGS1_9ORYZ|nr:hypothetical protein E2562_038782 [Oryza meyeriana var. granulata]
MAVVISIIGAVEEVAVMVASKMAVGDGSLVLRRASPTSFLLFLPDMAVVERAGSGSARQRRRPRSPSPAAGSGLGGGGDPARQPVWDWLGPTAGGGSHVAKASPSDVDAWETHEADAPSPASVRATFINRIGRRTSGLLPAPSIGKRQVKTLPRRSQRLAGADVEFQPGNDISRRSKKCAMSSLGIIDEHDGIDQQAQDEYAQLFGQQLSASHLQALAALLGWVPPEEFCHGGDTVAFA